MGLRLKSYCKGSFKCSNDNCPFFKMFNKHNHIQAKQVTKCVCQECGTPMDNIVCPAEKVWEFMKWSTQVTVHHTGYHTCPTIRRPQVPNELVAEFKRDPSVKPSVATAKILMTAVRTADKESIEELAFNLSNERLNRNTKQKICSTETAKGMADLQNKCLREFKDPYMLYEYQLVEARGGDFVVRKCTVDPANNAIITRESVTSEPDKFQTYALKSSRTRVQIMREMLEKGSMEEEWVFIDAKHNRVRGKGKFMKTLGISTYHGLLKKVVWLARLDCEKEDEPTVTLLLRLLDEMLKAESGQSFIPKTGYMTDEAGGLHAALKKRLGETYDTKVVSCRFHLSQCTNRHANSAFVGREDKDEKVKTMKKLVHTMVHAATPNLYNSAYQEVVAFLEKEKLAEVITWLEWWDRRRNHVMQAFRPDGAPNTNLAEASHASMQISGGADLSLLDSAVFDASESFKIETLLKGYSNKAIAGGKGKSVLQRQIINDQLQLQRSNALMTELQTAHQQGVGGPTPPLISAFKPNPGASHRADKGTSDGEKRPKGRKRVKISKQLRVNMKEAESMEKTHEIVSVDVSTPTHATVCLRNRVSHSFQVITMDQAPECSCIDPRTTPVASLPCKHLLFIHHTIQTSDETLIQHNYNNKEIRDIIRGLQLLKSQSSAAGGILVPSTQATPPADGIPSTQATPPADGIHFTQATPPADGIPFTQATPPPEIPPRPQRTPPAIPSREFKPPQKGSRELKLQHAVDTASEPYELTLLTSPVKKCYGCDGLFEQGLREPPFNIIIKHLECRPKCTRNKEWYASTDKKPAYYHLQSECVKMIHPDFSKSDVVMHPSFQAKLRPDHMDVLGRAKFLWVQNIF